MLVTTACDSNGNCGVKRLGRFRPAALEVAHRIDGRPVDADLEVQVRAEQWPVQSL